MSCTLSLAKAGKRCDAPEDESKLIAASAEQELPTGVVKFKAAWQATAN
jgi:hypothetical protein